MTTDQQKQPRDRLAEARKALHDCPECGSFRTNVYEIYSGLLLLGCNNCSHKWSLTFSRVGLAETDSQETGG